MTLKVAVFTGTRAEYGLLRYLLTDLQEKNEIEVRLIVSGSHLSPEFGYTVAEIESDGFRVDEKVEILLSSSTKVGVAKSLGLGTMSFAETLDRLKPDVLIVLGDRYEALAMAQAALMLEIPIAHLHGGEISRGSLDDSIRHMITKASALHFVSNEQHRQRVIQMGESPSRVFNVGALVCDHVLRTSRATRSVLTEKFDFDFSVPFCMLTYHPSAFSEEDPQETLRNIFQALQVFPNLNVVATYPNADAGGKEIIGALREASELLGSKMLLVESLGIENYHRAIEASMLVIGNSSSGIIEAPFFRTPSVNVGSRQIGRVAATSVIHSGTSVEEITRAIGKAVEVSWDQVTNPYFNGGSTSKAIVELLLSSNLESKKVFFDIVSEVL